MINRIWGWLENAIKGILNIIFMIFHKELTEDKEKDILQFIKFGAVGASNTLISYTIYSISVYFGLHYLLGSILGFIVSVINSYYWNNKYVFQRQHLTIRNHIASFFKMVLSYGLTGLIVQNIFLYVLVEAGISKYIAPILIMVITIPLNFILNRAWAFKK